MTTELQRCPRRSESFHGLVDRSENPDKWELRAGRRHCDYCGSLHPDDVLARLAAGEEIGPTDKNYKAYMPGHDKVYFQHFDEAQSRAFIDLYNDRTMQIGYPGHFYSVPFFMGPAK